MALPSPPPFSDPIPNPSPTIPNVAAEYIVRGPYWDMKLSSEFTVTADGQFKRVGSSTVYPTANTSYVESYSGHVNIGQGLSVVGGNNLQIGTGAGRIPYYVKVAQGNLILGNAFYVNPSTGHLELD
jgi:hypothetical protein